MSLFFKFFVCERVLSKEEWGRFALFAKNWLHRWLRSKLQVGKGILGLEHFGKGLHEVQDLNPPQTVGRASEQRVRPRHGRPPGVVTCSR